VEFERDTKRESKKGLFGNLGKLASSVGSIGLDALKTMKKHTIDKLKSGDKALL